MLKSILIGVDGSPSSTAAVELGIQWAKRFNALLVGIGIVDDATIYPPDAETLGADYHNWERDEQVIQEANHKVKQLLASFAERCAGVDISFNVLQDAGLPYEEILRESQRYDLVLFGHDTHFRGACGHSAVREFLLGSITKAVLKESPMPVFLCH